MSKIWEMLKKEKVEWKRLGEVCETITDYVAAGSFKSNSKNVIYLNSPDYAQLVRTKDIKSNFNNKEIFVYVDKKAFDYLYRVNLDEECLVLPNIGNCGEIYHILPEKLPYKNNVLGPNAILLKSRTENMKFLYYLFCSKNFQKNLYKITSKIGQGKFNKTDLKEIKIPIPSLKTQEKIVNILDKFTECTTNLCRELNKELELRIQQYEYYRAMLLSEEYMKQLTERFLDKNSDLICKVTLRTVATYYNKKISAEKVNSKTYIGVENLLKDKGGKVDCNHLPKSGTLNAFTQNDILIGNIRPYLRKIWLADIDGGTNGDVLTICIKNEFKNKLLPKFLYQTLSSEEFFYYNIKFSKGAKMPRGDKNKIMEYEFFLPPLKVQEHIVAILDKFDTIVHDLKIGLPREIELRQKQYEYYRDKLLAFEKVD